MFILHTSEYNCECQYMNNNESEWGKHSPGYCISCSFVEIIVNKPKVVYCPIIFQDSK